MVSAVGAQEGSFNYYFHIKGKLENEIKKIGYKNICFARPGHLLGKRKDFRGYEIPVLESGLSFAAPFMKGPLRNFRQIEAKKVPKSMVMNLVAKEFVACQNHENPGILILSEFAGSARELYNAVISNPYDSDNVAKSIGTECYSS